jgi:hypothetical protein
MRLRIWVMDDQLSPDTDQTIYIDIDMKLDLPLLEMQALALSFAGSAAQTLTTIEKLQQELRVADNDAAEALRQRDQAKNELAEIKDTLSQS